MNTAWLLLVLAGLFEIGWPVGIKVAQSPGRGVIGIIFAIFCMAVSGWLLWIAQKQIPMGTAYAVWTGIGAAGTFIVGGLVYGDPLGGIRILAVVLIIAGVVLLKLAH
ncbi:MAG: multidrug efflux SMR transporter [Chthoniobacterales bacterium]